MIARFQAKKAFARIFMASVLMASVPAAAFALEAKEGRLKVVLYEDNARFNVYYLSDIAKDQYQPLLFERDPRTTSLTLFVDNKSYRMGETSDFRTSAAKTPGGLAFTFRSSFCVVTQTFSFVKSEGSTLSDGVLMEVKVENLGEKDLRCGLRVILDSWLGEKSQVHFVTDARQKVSGETRFDGQTKDRWIVSPDGDKHGTGLMVMLKSGDARYDPDSVLAANWSRLSNSYQEYDYNPSRNFTLQPYSINDSALALDWANATLQRSQTRVFSCLLGNRNEKGFTLKPQSGPTADAFASASTATTSPGAAETMKASVQTDLLAVRDLLDAINEKLSKGEQPTADELKVMQGVIDRLNSRQPRYE